MEISERCKAHVGKKKGEERIKSINWAFEAGVFPPSRGYVVIGLGWTSGV